MMPWYEREGVRIAAIALAAGLLLGGLIALAVGGPKLSPFGTPKPSAAEAIASDQAATHKPAAEATAKPEAKSAKATNANTAAAATAAGVATPSPDAADRSDLARAKDRTKRERGDRAPRRAGAAPAAAPPRRRAAARRRARVGPPPAAHPRRRASTRVVSRLRPARKPSRGGSTTPTFRP